MRGYVVGESLTPWDMLQGKNATKIDVVDYK